jgi:hypothetical protein
MGHFWTTTQETERWSFFCRKIRGQIKTPVGFVPDTGVFIMKLSKKAIKEFREIYLEENGIELEEEKAEIKALSFLMVIKIIYKPVPETS